MSSYYSARLDALMLKCDGCGLKVEVCKRGQTDSSFMAISMKTAG